MELQTVGSPLLWGGFTVFVLAMLAIDLGVFHRKAHEVHYREAIAWTVVWIALSLIFNYLVYRWFGPQKGLEFLTGYLIEKALSVDNVFVFIVIFSYFAVPKELHHKVLFWGVLGALVMRGIFIFLGAALLQRFHWIIYIFGAILIVTGFKLMFQTDEDLEPEKNPFYKMAKRFFHTVPGWGGGRFFVNDNGRRGATMLFLVLVSVEATDLIFAVDSIPAIFAITTDPFIVYTSNVFAILGLRALYFVLSGVMDLFHYLKVGLALVLLFVGTKMLIAHFYKIPIGVSLVVVAGIIFLSIVLSLLLPKKADHEESSGE